MLRVVKSGLPYDNKDVYNVMMGRFCVARVEKYPRGRVWLQDAKGAQFPSEEHSFDNIGQAITWLEQQLVKGW